MAETEKSASKSNLPCSSRNISCLPKTKQNAKQVPFQLPMSTRTQLSSQPWEHEVMKCMRTTEKKFNKKNLLVGHLLLHFLTIKKGHFEECEASCPGPSPSSLCAHFYPFWLCPSSRHSDALILIMTATVFWVLAMSQALT